MLVYLSTFIHLGFPIHPGVTMHLGIIPMNTSIPEYMSIFVHFANLVNLGHFIYYGIPENFRFSCYSSIISHLCIVVNLCLSIHLGFVVNPTIVIMAQIVGAFNPTTLVSLLYFAKISHSDNSVKNNSIFESHLLRRKTILLLDLSWGTECFIKSHLSLLTMFDNFFLIDTNPAVIYFVAVVVSTLRNPNTFLCEGFVDLFFAQTKIFQFDYGAFLVSTDDRLKILSFEIYDIDLHPTAPWSRIRHSF